MSVRCLVVVLMATCLTGWPTGVKGDGPPPVPPPAQADSHGMPPGTTVGGGPVGAAPASSLPPMTPTAPVLPSSSPVIMPATPGLSPEPMGQGSVDRRPRLRGRLRAKIQALFHGGN
jgi:hypothetical protein